MKKVKIEPRQRPEIMGKAVSVESVCIQELAYLPIAKVLHVTIDNKSYAYKEVPFKVFTQFNESLSKGNYFVKKVKGNYEFTKI